MRAAAKNFLSVLVVCDPSDYSTVLQRLKGTGAPPLTSSTAPSLEESSHVFLPEAIWGAEGEFSKEERRKFAHKAFCHTASYDSAIASWLSGPSLEARAPTEVTTQLPSALNLSAQQVETLRYGENPHQQGTPATDPAASILSLCHFFIPNMK